MFKLPPTWLSPFQSEMSQYLCQPLDAGSGTLLAHQPPPSLLKQLEDSKLNGRSVDSGLLTYNRQYWFRLLSVMQGELPLTAALMGLWSFNRIAQDYLVFAPPGHFDIQKIAGKFLAFLHQHANEMSSKYRQVLPHEALLQAVQCDQAFQQVFLAPAYRPIEMSPALAANFTEMTLLAAESWNIISEDWKFMAARSRLSERTSALPLKMPDAWRAPRSWLIFRSGQKVGHLKLDPLQAKLYSLLKLKSVGAALQDLEQICPRVRREALPSLIQDWMALSMQLEFWTAIDS